MAKPRRANGHDKNTRHVVRIVAQILASGEPTVFRWEAWCRYTLRGNLCLQGISWTRSDAKAADIVRKALDLLNVTRPPWLWGQREYTMDSTATRISFTHCLQCGARLPENRPKFCAGRCGDLYRAAFQTAEVHVAARERALASLKARRDRAEPRQCETCGTWFKSAKPEQRFCSRQCSGGRSVQEKMNGKHHPWMNGNGKIGAGAANGATGSSERTATSDECTAPPNANIRATTSSSHASAPRPGAS